jgi:hypothetical protein
MATEFKNKKVSFSFSIDVETLHKLHELSKSFGLDTSKTIRVLIAEAYEKAPKI